MLHGLKRATASEARKIVRCADGKKTRYWPGSGHLPQSRRPVHAGLRQSDPAQVQGEERTRPAFDDRDGKYFES